MATRRKDRDLRGCRLELSRIDDRRGDSGVAATSWTHLLQPNGGEPPATSRLWSIAEDGTDERREMDLGTFRSIDVWFDVSRNGDVAWAPFQGGRHELWSATLK